MERENIPRGAIVNHIITFQVVVDSLITPSNTESLAQSTPLAVVSITLDFGMNSVPGELRAVYTAVG